MRDIGARISRYRLSRYAPPDDRVRRRLRWAWPLVGVWLVYVGVVSDHSFYRLWRLSDENARARAELASLKSEIDRLVHELTDPSARKQVGERMLRERDGMAAPHEIIYRIEGDADSARAR